MLALLARYLLGILLVSWRYMWTTTPLRREEGPGDGTDLPPPIPEELADSPLQSAASGVGPLFHRRFWVHVADSRRSPAEVIASVVDGFHRFVPREVVGVRREAIGRLELGEEFEVQMPGPWNGPVRVIQADESCLRLATLPGHLEAGQIRFRAGRQGDLLVFEIEAWARPATKVVQLLYVRLRLAKEVQLNMWVRFCQSVVRASDGRLVDGVHISTRAVPEHAIPLVAGEPDRIAGTVR